MNKLILFLLAISVSGAIAKPVSGPLKYLRLQGARKEVKTPVELGNGFLGHTATIIIPRSYPNQVAFGMQGSTVIKRYSNLDAELTLSDKMVYDQINDEIQSMILMPEKFNFFSFALTSYQIQICAPAPLLPQRLCLDGPGVSLERYLEELERHNDGGINLLISTEKGKNLSLGFATPAEFRSFFNIPVKKSQPIRNALAECAIALTGTWALTPPVVPTLKIN
ncbi:MAG: hypothetical protein ACXVA9_03800 [Bdellovibrionales bacterium]